MHEKHNKLELKDYCLGMENAFIAQGVTLLTVSKQTKLSNQGYIKWVERMIPEWELILNEHSGGNVRIIKTYPHKSDPLGKIEAEIYFSGELLKERLHERSGTDIINAVKKRLALDVLDFFPPPFNTEEPLFCESVEDVYRITPDSRYAEKFFSCFQKKEAEEIFLRDAHMHKAQIATLKRTPTGGELTVRWLKDMTDRDRWAFTREIECDFSSYLEIRCDCKN